MDKNRLKELFGKITKYSNYVESLKNGNWDNLNHAIAGKSLLECDLKENYMNDMNKIILYFIKILYKKEHFMSYLNILIEIDYKEIIDVFTLILEIINILKIDLDKIKLKGDV